MQLRGWSLKLEKATHTSEKRALGNRKRISVPGKQGT